jgi:hypothetical protein
VSTSRAKLETAALWGHVRTRILQRVASWRVRPPKLHPRPNLSANLFSLPSSLQTSMRRAASSLRHQSHISRRVTLVQHTQLRAYVPTAHPQGEQNAPPWAHNGLLSHTRDTAASSSLLGLITQLPFLLGHIRVALYPPQTSARASRSLDGH